MQMSTIYFIVNDPLLTLDLMVQFYNSLAQGSSRVTKSIKLNYPAPPPVLSAHSHEVLMIPKITKNDNYITVIC